ncbi:histidinol dehydrogenase [Pseudomonadota bacterium]
MNNVVDIQRLDSNHPEFAQQLQKLLDRDVALNTKIESTVQEILAQVHRRGNLALIEYTNKFDQLNIADAAQLEMPVQRLRQAHSELDEDQRKALEHAAERIQSYHEHQLQESWSYRDPEGNLLGQQVTSLDRVGLYVPGGKAAYPSSVLMTAIPAKVARVPELIMVVPTPRGGVNELVLAAAHLAGVDRVFTIGGAQAIAAMAYGTETVPAVDKIVGPGNAYVASAKRQVFGRVGIDMIAGPSEVVVIIDSSVDPEWVAMDLFAQAEHDEMAQSILISDSDTMIEKVVQAIDKLLPQMEREQIIRASLAQHGAIITVPNLDVAADVANKIAPEHLELLVETPENLSALIRHAGAIFMGRFSAESLGDYCAGPNHVLPTSGTARFSSPLGTYEFQKRTSLIGCSAAGAAKLAKIASILARSEGLTAHARSAEYRIQATDNSQ